MFDVTEVGSSVSSFKSYPPQPSYTRAVVILEDGSQYVFGSDAGQTLRVEIPFGTLEMAQRIHYNIIGYRYRPYEATGAILDPAAELGDGVVIKGVQSGIYTMDTTFGHLYRADISAPSEEEIDYTAPYKSQETRRVNRSLQHISADLSVAADRITAEVKERKADSEELWSKIESTSDSISAFVTKTGGDPKSFGWELTSESWSLKSNGGTVLKADKDGVEITGKITATGGRIGGFNINANCLSYNGLDWASKDIAQGAYIGINGLRLGQNFFVDMFGNLTAKNGTFNGTIYAQNIAFGENGGYLSGGAIASNTLNGSSLVIGTVDSTYLSSGVNTSLSRAESAYAVCIGNARATWLKTNTLSANTIYLGGSISLGTTQITYKDGNGKTSYLNVVTWNDNVGA